MAGNGRRAVFVDRDGTLNFDPHYLRHVDDFQLLPGAGEAIRLLNEAGWLVFVVTNQSAISRGFLTHEMLDRIHGRLRDEVGASGGRFDGIFYCPHLPDDRCECRKPQLGMIRQAQAHFPIDLARSWVIGDSWVDVELGRAAGARTAVVPRNQQGEHAAVEADIRAESLLSAVRQICEEEQR